MARSSRAWETGQRTRVNQCQWCGGEHRRGSKEQRECRNRRGKVDDKPSLPKGQRKPGDELTRYATDPLKGDKIGHAIAKQLKKGQSERKAAKMFNVSLERVREVAHKIGKA